MSIPTRPGAPGMQNSAPTTIGVGNNAQRYGERQSESDTLSAAAQLPIVLLDCDGVLADFTSGMLDVVHKVTGRRYTPEDVTEFDFCAALDLSADEASDVKRFISSDTTFCFGLALFDGARDGVRTLQSIADVYVVTSPWNSNASWTYQREQWLRRKLDIGHSRVIHTSAKHLVRGDFFVDDKTDTVERWQAANPSGVAVQWQTPHNRRDACAARTTRSWDELCRWVGGQS